MTPEVSQQIAKLLGQVTVSELGPSPITSMTDEYLLYESVGTAYRLGAYDLCSYLCKHIFTFLFQDREDHVLRINPQNYIEQGDTPVTLARRLIDMVPGWIGDAKPANGGKNLSEIWFKHFQYYYFDNLNNRLPTMLLKYGPGEPDRLLPYDIAIWIDSSGSMENVINAIKASVQVLATQLLAQNPENRVAIVQYGQKEPYHSTPWEGGIGYYSDEQYIVGGLTSDPNTIASEINQARDDKGDESAWSLWKLVWKPHDGLTRPPDYDGRAMFANWEEFNWRENSKKIVIAITDEPMDFYTSLMRRYAMPFKPGKTQELNANGDVEPVNLLTDTVTTKEELATANWCYSRDLIRCSHDYGNGWDDPNRPAWPNDPRTCGSYPPWETGSPFYNETTEQRLAIWAKPFNDMDVKFYFINAYDWTISAPNVFRFVGTFPYSYAIEHEIISQLKAGGKSFDAIPEQIPQTLQGILENEFQEPEEYNRFWSNCMWGTHLSLPLTTQKLPRVKTKGGEFRRLYVPFTAAFANQNPNASILDATNFIWTRYDKRNYIRIVGMDTGDYSTSGWDKTNDHDWVWTDEKFGTPLEPSRTDENVIPEIDQKMGDIDQTLKALDEFLDDFADSLQIKRHKGKVIFTASTKPAPLDGSWVNVVGSAGSTAQNAFVWSGSAVDGAGNAIQLINTPQHHHNTVGVDGAHAIVRNVSVVGRPEGEDVGGIAKVPTAERIPGDNVGRQEDTIQHLPANLTRSISVSGAYSGSVRYTGKLSTGADRNSPEAVNNMPLYYIMRAFRYNGSDES